MRRRSAYYSRAGSFSRSYNAHVAENNDRYPRSRAARHLGLSVAAFDAGCQYAGITTSEWHHVGKFANCIDYWDTNECAASPAFWMGVARFVKKAKKKDAVRRAREAQHDREAIAEFDCGFRPTGRTPKQIAGEDRSIRRAFKLGNLRRNMRMATTGDPVNDRQARFAARLAVLLSCHGCTDDQSRCFTEAFTRVHRLYDRASQKQKGGILSGAEMMNIFGHWVDLINKSDTETRGQVLDACRKNFMDKIRRQSWQENSPRKKDIEIALRESPTVDFFQAGKHRLEGDRIVLIGKRRTISLTLEEFKSVKCDRHEAFLKFPHHIAA